MRLDHSVATYDDILRFQRRPHHYSHPRCKCWNFCPTWNRRWPNFPPWTAPTKRRMESATLKTQSNLCTHLARIEKLMIGPVSTVQCILKKQKKSILKLEIESFTLKGNKHVQKKIKNVKVISHPHRQLISRTKFSNQKEYYKVNRCFWK